jgi:hypothetical protein
VLAKLWSVLPKLFEWPPVRSVAHAVERASLGLLVGGAVSELVTGILNVSNFYPWKFSFYDPHLYGAWVFIAAFTVHVGIKLPRMLHALRERPLRRELRTSLADTRAESPDPDGLVAAEPAAPTVSRRGLLAGVGLGSLAVLALSAGQVAAGQAGGVQRAKPQLGQRRVDSARVGAVQPGTAGLAQDGTAGDVVRPEKAVAQPGQVRVVGWVAVGVDAGGLHPAVPGVAVEIVGELRMPGDGHRAQRDAARGQHR